MLFFFKYFPVLFSLILRIHLWLLLHSAKPTKFLVNLIIASLPAKNMVQFIKASSRHILHLHINYCSKLVSKITMEVRQSLMKVLFVPPEAFQTRPFCRFLITVLRFSFLSWKVGRKYCGEDAPLPTPNFCLEGNLVNCEWMLYA